MGYKKRIIVFGTGRFYQGYKKKLNKYEIVGFIDNDICKQGSEIDHKQVYAPDDIKTLEYDYIYIMSKTWPNMREQLISLGIDEQIIRSPIFLESEYSFYMPQIWCGEGCLLPPDFLLVSYSLGRTGAPRAILETAKVLKNIGFRPILLSNEDGPLKEEILAAEIPVAIANKLECDVALFEKWIQGFDYIIVNTIMYYSVLERCRLPKKIIWWLHEASQYYNDIFSSIKRNPGLSTNIIPYAVGKIAIQNFERAYKMNAYNLLYGMEEYEIYPVHSGKKFIYLLVGSIVDRKGYDILFHALDRMPQSVKENAEVWIVGFGDIQFLSNLSMQEKEDILNSRFIRFWGEIASEEVRTIYEQADVLVCPSREDPMPIVITEAMMWHIPVIVSDGCGTAPIVKEHNAGIVVKKEDPDKLAEAMIYAYNNREELDTFTENARKVYEKYFSMDVHKKNIIALLQKEYEVEIEESI